MKAEQKPSREIEEVQQGWAVHHEDYGILKGTFSPSSPTFCVERWCDQYSFEQEKCKIVKAKFVISYDDSEDLSRYWEV